MGLTALALGGWITLYCGVSLLRTGLPENQPDHAAADPRKKLAALGYSLIVLGLVILARAVLH
jgi:hypothetical protein